MPDDPLHKAKDFMEQLLPKKQGLSHAAEEAQSAGTEFVKQAKVEQQTRKDFAREKAVPRDENVSGRLGRLELVETQEDGTIHIHVKGLAAPHDKILLANNVEKSDPKQETRLSPHEIPHSAWSLKLEETFKCIEKLHLEKEPDLKSKSEAFTKFQMLTPIEQYNVVTRLHLKHLNEIHGLEHMDKYPPLRHPDLIVPGELVDLAKSKNRVDNQFALRDLDSYNCIDFALARMKGGMCTWQDNIGLGQNSTVYKSGLSAMGINEVHGSVTVGDFVAIKEGVFGFEHAAVVESISQDGTITVIEKLGSVGKVPVIRQTWIDFSRTWDVRPSEIRVFRKQ